MFLEDNIFPVLSEIARRHLVITQLPAGPGFPIGTSPAFPTAVQSLPNQRQYLFLSPAGSLQCDSVCSVGL